MEDEGQTTEVQGKVLRAVYQLSRRRGFPPTVREIMDEMGLQSTSTVFAHLCQLVEAGMLVKFARSARAIRLSETGVEYIQNEIMEGGQI